VIDLQQSAMVGEVSDFIPGRCRMVTVAGSEIGVFNVENHLYAVRNYCPHRGAPICLGWVTGTMLPSDPGRLEWGLEGRVLRCPWHRWEFDLTTGQTMFGIDKRRLITYRVTVLGSQVYLALGETERKYLAARHGAHLEVGDGTSC
jgi:nitrite reductase (NADH) small subunit